MKKIVLILVVFSTFLTGCNSDNLSKQNNTANGLVAKDSLAVNLVGDTGTLVAHGVDAQNQNKLLASGMCDCLTPVVNLQEKVKGLMERNDKEGLKKIESELERLSKIAALCGKKLEAKYGVMKNAKDQKEVFMELSKLCPGVSDLLGVKEAVDQPLH